jgi:hypothetical protein
MQNQKPFPIIVKCFVKKIATFLQVKDITGFLWYSIHGQCFYLLLCDMTITKVQKKKVGAKATSQLPTLQDTPPITMADLYCKLSVFDIQIWPTYHRRLIIDIKRFSHLL